MVTATYEFWLCVFLLGDLFMIYTFAEFYGLFMYYKYNIDDKTDIFLKGKEILEQNMGLAIKDFDTKQFDTAGTESSYAFEWYRQLGYTSVRLMVIPFLAIIVKTLTGILAVMSSWKTAQVNKYF